MTITGHFNKQVRDQVTTTLEVRRARVKTTMSGQVKEVRKEANSSTGYHKV